MSPIAVIGAGFTGTLTAIHLARLLPGQAVILFEESAEAGPGLAYRQDDPHSLLNVPAKRMSAYPDEPDHFYNHIHRLFGDAVGADDFLPRQVYGAYIKGCLEDALGRCPNLQIDHRCVVDVQPLTASGGAALTFKDGTTLSCSRVVLATGNQGSAFSQSPWAEHTLCARQASSYQTITPGSTVLLIGTGLTMVDAVLELERRGDAVEIHAISRNGLLPRPFRPANPAGVPDLSGLVGKPLRQKVRIFRSAVKQHQQAGGCWRDLFAALRAATPSLWQEMSACDRKRFLRFLSPFWEVHRHQCAPAAAKRFEEIVDQGKLDIRRGTIVAVEKYEGRLRLGLAPRSYAAPTRWLEADFILDATGPARDVRTIEHPLIVSLLKRGLVTPDAHCLGMQVDASYRSIEKSGESVEWLFVNGPMLRARFFEATAVPELRQHAQAVAEKIAAGMAEKAAPSLAAV